MMFVVMEQMYLIEILVDKVTIFSSEADETSGANKNLIIKIKFGPSVQFIIKEGQLAVNENTKDDIIECDEMGRRKWTRTIRVGKSYLFPSYSDTILMILSKFPLEIEVWNDDENEVEIFVGIGTMHWETQFFHMLKETSNPKKNHEPLTIKQHTPLFAECCCKQVGEIAFILRLSTLGDSIITEFQQLMKDPDAFVFRTNRAPSMFQCKRVEGDDPNFCMVGSVYETTTLEDPDVVLNATQKIEVCTELQSCGVGQQGGSPSCEHGGEDTEPKPKKYPVDKIRMGDITGPCGNANCSLAHKVKNYIRALDTYKKEATGKVAGTKPEDSKNVCGTCTCKDDRYHRDGCPDKDTTKKAVCSGCGGVTKEGETCEDRKNKAFGTGATPSGSKTTVHYVTQVPQFKESMYGRDYIIENMAPRYNNQPQASAIRPTSGCCCRQPPPPTQSVYKTYSYATSSTSTPDLRYPDSKPSTRSLGLNNPTVYTVSGVESKRKMAVYNCTEVPDDKDCKCDPPKPKPPCKTFDCECLTKVDEIASRKKHKPYCPSYKHKATCPVTMRMHEDEEKKKVDEDEDEAEPLPYGLPPIQLGPCPIMGRPCSVPDGFARMYKNAVLPPLPPSYNDAGKVCCSKEYERVKKAIKEYMRSQRDNDFRCVNKFNVDTERRCCDKEQILLSLMGKGCCGSHKMAIQDQYKEQHK